MTDQPMSAAGGEPPPQRSPEGGEEGIRFRDNRRIDPKTYEPRVPPAAAPPPTVGEQAKPPTQPALSDEAATKVEELTADLQRLSAEYANYRKRVDRDRELQRDLTVVAVLNDLLPVLDDLARARDHGELEGGFKAVGEAVEGVADKYGLERFGQEGEPFDPKVHEAMTSEPNADVTTPTVGSVYQIGYRVKDRVLRPARVAVLDTE